MGIEYKIMRVDDKNPILIKRIARRVIEIVNYYIEDPEDICADFHDKKINTDKVEKQWMYSIKHGYPFCIAEAMVNGHVEIIGFGFLFPHGELEIGTFKRIAELAIYIDQAYRGNKIGPNILKQLISDAKDISVDNILSKQSSKNKKSIEFHIKNGFKICGTIENAGKWKGEDIDIVLMQCFI